MRTLGAKIRSVKAIRFVCALVAISVLAIVDLRAQTRIGTPAMAGSRNDVSNKALITKTNTDSVMAVAALRKVADDYYAWRNENYPVNSSDAGLHTWDDRLTDYSQAKIAERAQHVHSLLEKVRAMKTDAWPKNDRIDWILFRAQLENVDFGDRVLKFERTD